MKISIISALETWMNSHIPAMLSYLKKKGHDVVWMHDVSQLDEGDVAFYLSCEQIVKPVALVKNEHNIVVHASALPQGKGWSPVTWQVLGGCNNIPLTLFEAVERVDSGTIYLQETVELDGGELLDEIHEKIGARISQMCLQFIDGYSNIVAAGREQEGEESFYPRRRAEDSEIDPQKSIEEQFNLLRVVDNQKYPAFFILNGQCYILRITKKKNDVL